MKRVYSVLLNATLVGHLSEGEDGRVSFRLTEAYREMPDRPVLSQSFEDDLERVYRGKQRALPAFFANLTPEGPLRELIETSLNIPHFDELALLGAVGHDLPGAVVIQPSNYAVEEVNGNGDDQSKDSPAAADAEDEGLRFSLAGVQLKFSVMSEPERVTLPAHGQDGDWIVKLDSSRFPQVVENEYATLHWARATGFEVPDCRLLPLDALPPKLRSLAPGDSRIFVIRRYDRDQGTRIHQEDFAQVVKMLPSLKYSNVNYEQCARLVASICGESEYAEFVRRLTFVVVSGNGDAHLKNWSLIYPDAINARLSPLYDQVCTIAWSEVSPALALKLAGVRNFYKVDEAAFVRLAELARVDVDLTISTMRQTLERSAAAWRESDAHRLMPAAHRQALQTYWARVPLLKNAGFFE